MDTPRSKKRPVRSCPSVCTCVNVRRASRAITKIYDTMLEPGNLKVTQYSALVNILQYGPLSISKLATILSLDRTTLVRNLKTLEESGLIESTVTSDTRERGVAVTEKGKSSVESAMPYWRRAQKLIKEHLGLKNLQQLDSLVTTLEDLAKTENNGAAGTSA